MKSQCLQSLVKQLVNPVAGMFGRHHFGAYHSILFAIGNLCSKFHLFQYTRSSEDKGCISDSSCDCLCIAADTKPSKCRTGTVLLSSAIEEESGEGNVANVDRQLLCYRVLQLCVAFSSATAAKPKLGPETLFVYHCIIFITVHLLSHYEQGYTSWKVINENCIKWQPRQNISCVSRQIHCYSGLEVLCMARIVVARSSKMSFD